MYGSFGQTGQVARIAPEDPVIGRDFLDGCRYPR